MLGDVLEEDGADKRPGAVLYRPFFSGGFYE